MVDKARPGASEKLSEIEDGTQCSARGERKTECNRGWHTSLGQGRVQYSITSIMAHDGLPVARVGVGGGGGSHRLKVMGNFYLSARRP